MHIIRVIIMLGKEQPYQRCSVGGIMSQVIGARVHDSLKIEQNCSFLFEYILFFPFGEKNRERKR
jgi:hypothetical protein